MKTIETAKAKLVGVMTSGGEHVVICDAALSQISRMRDLLVEKTGYSPERLTMEDITLANDIIPMFNVKTMEAGSVVIDGVLQAADEALFNAAIAEMSNNLQDVPRVTAMAGNMFLPSIMIADYVIEHKSYNR